MSRQVCVIHRRSLHCCLLLPPWSSAPTEPLVTSFLWQRLSNGPTCKRLHATFAGWALPVDACLLHP